MSGAAHGGTGQLSSHRQGRGMLRLNGHDQGERGATLLTSLHRAQPDSAGVMGRFEPFSPWDADGAGIEQQERRAWMLLHPEFSAHWASIARCVAQIPGMKARPEATR